MQQGRMTYQQIETQKIQLRKCENVTNRLTYKKNRSSDKYKHVAGRMTYQQRKAQEIRKCNRQDDIQKTEAETKQTGSRQDDIPAQKSLENTNMEQTGCHTNKEKLKNYKNATGRMTCQQNQTKMKLGGGGRGGGGAGVEGG